MASLNIMQQTHHNKKTNGKEGGFVILYTILLTTVILSIAIAIVDVFVKQVFLLSIEKESQKAFYAADTGAECALYWDNAKDVFITAGPLTVNCVGQTIPVTNAGTLYTFSIPNLPQGACAKVFIDKTAGTEINVYGYNITCPPLVPDNQRRFERGLRVKY